MPDSMFKRVTRYRVGSKQDPRENRLTEVTAAVLDRVPGLARDVVLTMLQTAAGDRHSAAGQLRTTVDLLRSMKDPRVTVSTQVPTASGKFVDLEVVFRSREPGTGGRVTIWVEVKHGAGLHGEQLESYATDMKLIEAKPEQRAIVLLAPHGDAVLDGALPSGTITSTWRSLAHTVRTWRQVGDLTDVHRFLIDEYIDYLKEENLVEPEALTTEHAWVLERWNAAGAAAESVTELAQALIEARWGKCSDSQKSFGLSYWATFSCLPDSAGGADAASETWRSAVFEWGLPNDEGRDEARDAAVFNAGVTFLLVRSNPANLDGNSEWLADRRSEGFEYVDRYFKRLMRFKYPQELLVANTLQEQAELLAGWVVGTFELLADSPPPA